MKDVIRKEQWVKHSMQDVWNAISQSEEISAWFIQADFRAEVGYAYTFTHESTKITGKVLEADPNYNLVYTWIVGDTDVETTVKWKLQEKEEGTLLTLEHSGISKYPDEALATQMFDSFNKGWDGCMKNLNTYLQKENVE